MRRIYLVAIALLLPSLTYANGAMGLGLERWDLRFWWAYVIATVVAEAWLIGRWIGYSWEQSLLRSTLANLFTGGICGAGLLAPFLHYTFAGTAQNPNPLLDSFKILLYFSAPSAMLEYFFWDKIEKKGKFWRVLGVHVLTVPFGLAILLIPLRPYQGLEQFTSGARGRQVLPHLSKFVEEHQHLPSGDTLISFATEVSRGDPPVFLYTPHFSRFATGEDWQHPTYTLNRAVLGRKISDGLEDDVWVWILKRVDGTGAMWVNLRTGKVQTGDANSPPSQ